ncbi:MAG: glyoxylate/hydroxypyruvate reductase A [Devosiaceae bacterium]|nr:glyoxylate/hydroxypyruvate reductase A [Devosiaceae bacterium]
MLLLHLNTVDEEFWAKQLGRLLPNMGIVRRGDTFNASDIQYVFVWKPQKNAFDGLTNLKAILSLGAGVDALLAHPNLPENTPIVRFVDDELTQCMGDYVVANVSMHHRCFSQYRTDQKAKSWTQFFPPPSWDIRVGIMGLGVLGQDAAMRLLGLGYQVNGWSRSEKTIKGLSGFVGKSELDMFLAQTDILVNLLPLTPDTQSILNYPLFTKLCRTGLKGGPVLINAARGGHQVEADIARALTDGTLGAASLDVFEVEPLPKDSPLWQIENCYITPHIAAISNPESGASYFARVIREHENGRPLLNVVDNRRGY